MTIRNNVEQFNIQGIKNAWYCFSEEITSWPILKLSSITYSDDIILIGGNVFRRLSSDKDQMEFTQVTKLDNSGVIYEQSLSGFTRGNNKTQTLSYADIVRRKITVIFQEPNGKFRIMGCEAGNAKLINATSSKNVGAGIPGDEYKVSTVNELPSCYYEGYATIDTNGDLKTSFDMVVDFTASSTAVFVGNNITFTDTTTNSPTSWLWEFGDGTTSAVQNPVKNFASPGVYHVKLTATKSGVSKSITKYYYIYVSALATQSYLIYAVFEQYLGTLPAITIDSNNAATYTSIMQDGGSGTITIKKNGGAWVAFSSPLVLSIGDTLSIKRTVISANGWVKLNS